jgi:hypothetical protein
LDLHNVERCPVHRTSTRRTPPLRDAQPWPVWPSYQRGRRTLPMGRRGRH